MFFVLNLNQDLVLSRLTPFLFQLALRVGYWFTRTPVYAKERARKDGE